MSFSISWLTDTSQHLVKKLLLVTQLRLLGSIKYVFKVTQNILVQEQYWCILLHLCFTLALNWQILLKKTWKNQNSRISAFTEPDGARLHSCFQINYSGITSLRISCFFWRKQQWFSSFLLRNLRKILALLTGYFIFHFDGPCFCL